MDLVTKLEMETNALEKTEAKIVRLKNALKPKQTTKTKKDITIRTYLAREKGKMITESEIRKILNIVGREGKVIEYKLQSSYGKIFIKFKTFTSDFSCSTEPLLKLGFYIHGFDARPASMSAGNRRCVWIARLGYGISD